MKGNRKRKMFAVCNFDPLLIKCARKCLNGTVANGVAALNWMVAPTS